MDTFLCSRCGLSPERTQHGRLPPWEVAKAVAFATVLADIAEHFEQEEKEEEEENMGGREEGKKRKPTREGQRGDQ